MCLHINGIKMLRKNELFCCRLGLKSSWSINLIITQFVPSDNRAGREVHHVAMTHGSISCARSHKLHPFYAPRPWGPRVQCAEKRDNSAAKWDSVPDIGTVPWDLGWLSPIYAVRIHVVFLLHHSRVFLCVHLACNFIKLLVRTLTFVKAHY